MSLDVNVEPEEFNVAELHNCIQEVAKLKGIEDFVYQVEFACDKDANYIANVFRVHISESEKDNNFSVIVKTLVNTTKQELFKELHKREVIVYEEVFPKFKIVQEDIDEDKRVVVPECIYSSIEKDREILILEDLVLNGFEMDGKLAKFEKLDYLQVRLIVSELAKFHGLTFVLEKKDPVNFQKLTSKFKDIIFEETFLNKSKLRKYFNEAYASSLKLVLDKDARKILQQIEPKLLQFLRKHVQPKRVNVLCHGDCWINNILFKYEVNKQSRICFLDFQAMRYTSPTLDIVYFLYLCTDSEFRSEYFETLQNVYYDSIKMYLKLYDIEIDIVYPRDNFEKDIKDALPFGLVMALIEMRIVTTDIENGSINYFDSVLPSNTLFNNDGDLKKTKDNSIAVDRTLFAIRINDVVEESIHNGVLDKLICEINM